MRDWVDDALRLVGRILVLGVLSALAFALAGSALKPIFPLGVPTGADGLLLVSFVSVFALVIGHLAVVLIFERGDWTAVGAQPSAWRPVPVLVAAVAGLAVILVPAALLLGTGDLRLAEMPAGSWGSAALYSLLWLSAPALFEELMARGYVFGSIERQWGATAALSITSLGFGLLHLGNPGATAWSVGAVVLAGLFLGSVRLATGSIVAAWVAHVAVNWAQGGVLHAPISGLSFLPTPGYKVQAHGPDWVTGGAWGLEAGVVTALMLLVVIFPYLYASHRRRTKAPATRRP